MDRDLRNILILFGCCALLFTGFLSSCAYQAHTCKVEAIKAGIKAEQIKMLCQP